MDQLQTIADEKKNSVAAKKKELEQFEKKKKAELEETEAKRKKELEEYEQKKAKDLEELDKKRKELAELEKKKAKEIEETQELIDKSFQDLMRHKRQLIAEEEKLNTKNVKEKNQSIDDLADVEGLKGTGGGANYGKAFDKMKNPGSIYEVTTKEFYSNLTELRDKAARGEITPGEERFIEQLRERFENFAAKDNYLEQKDSNEYVRRSLNVIGQISTYSSHR